MRILYLYAEVMGYTLATIRELIRMGNEVHVVHWNHQKLTPFEIRKIPNLFLYSRSRQTGSTLRRLHQRIHPALTVVSGWQDPLYLHFCRHLRKAGNLVITGLDEQWHGSPKQKVGGWLGRLGILRRYFTHAWVAGPLQYEYARKLGFEKKRIVFDLYSADWPLFDASWRKHFPAKKKNYPHRFLYVGRFEPVKGIHQLMQAWQSLGAEKKTWELRMIGGGARLGQRGSLKGVSMQGFMQPLQLAQEMGRAGCLVLPSLKEPWGVCVHEAVAAGLPLLLSEAVGAAKKFLVSGFNGYSFEASKVENLTHALTKIICLPDRSLLEMGKASHALSNRITPVTSARALLSVLT